MRDGLFFAYFGAETPRFASLTAAIGKELLTFCAFLLYIMEKKVNDVRSPFGAYITVCGI